MSRSPEVAAQWRAVRPSCQKRTVGDAWDRQHWVTNHILCVEQVRVLSQERAQEAFLACGGRGTGEGFGLWEARRGGLTVQGGRVNRQIGHFCGRGGCSSVLVPGPHRNASYASATRQPTHVIPTWLDADPAWLDAPPDLLCSRASLAAPRSLHSDSPSSCRRFSSTIGTPPSPETPPHTASRRYVMPSVQQNNMEADTPSHLLLAFLHSQSQTALTRLYQRPSACLSIFRSVSFRDALLYLG